MGLFIAQHAHSMPIDIAVKHKQGKKKKRRKIDEKGKIKYNKPYKMVVGR